MFILGAVLCLLVTSPLAVADFIKPPGRQGKSIEEAEPWNFYESREVEWEPRDYRVTLEVWQEFWKDGELEFISETILTNSLASSTRYSLARGDTDWDTSSIIEEPMAFWFSLSRTSNNVRIAATVFLNITERDLASSSSALPSLTTETSISTGTQSSETSETTNDGQPTSTSPPDNSDDGLSVGAQAGIGAGVGVAALAILAGLGFFCWKKRRQNKESSDQNNQQSYTPVMSHNKAELDSSESARFNKSPQPYTPSDQLSRGVDERFTPGPEAPSELDAGPVMSELDGQSPYDHSGRR